MRSVTSIACIGVCCLLASMAVAEDPVYRDWSDQDWTVNSVTRASLEDTLTTCTGSSTSDGPLGVNLEQSNLDAGPPYVFPVIYLNRIIGEDGQPMAVAGEDVLTSWVFDGGAPITTALNPVFDEDAAQQRFQVPAEQAQSLLQAMHGGTKLVLNSPAFGKMTVSLSGFSAVYRKMADWCDFSTEGVL